MKFWGPRPDVDLKVWRLKNKLFTSKNKYILTTIKSQFKAENKLLIFEYYVNNNTNN